jgi:hypothetical protein
MMFKWATLVLAIMGLSTACSAAAETHQEVSRTIIAAGNSLTPFPPSFLGHPWAYSAALFSQLTIFSFAIGVIFLMLSCIDLKRDGCVHHGHRSWRSCVNVYRVSITLFMLSVVCGVAPNLLIYLSWGEVQADTLNIFFTVDKLLKASACVPFLWAIYLLVQNDEVMTLQLSLYRDSNDPLFPVGLIMKRHARSVGWIFVLAIGVTYAKWGAVPL